MHGDEHILDHATTWQLIFSNYWMAAAWISNTSGLLTKMFVNFSMAAA
jgi:hypothetical protein